MVVHSVVGNLSWIALGIVFFAILYTGI